MIEATGEVTVTTRLRPRKTVKLCDARRCDCATVRIVYTTKEQGGAKQRSTALWAPCEVDASAIPRWRALRWITLIRKLGFRPFNA